MRFLTRSVVGVLVGLFVGLPSSPFLVGAEQVVIAIDESGSMDDNQLRVVMNVELLFNELQDPQSLRNPSVGLVGYGAGVKFNHEAYTITPMTNDTSKFRAGLETLVANGAFEKGYRLALETATGKLRGPPLGLLLDPSVGFCLLIISDEPFRQSQTTRAEVEAAFASAGGVFFGVGRITDDDRLLAANTGGEVFDIHDFEFDPTGVINAVLAKCKATLPTPPPTPSPTLRATAHPTMIPTKNPTASPSKAPTKKPTPLPTKAPTSKPTAPPTKSPTQAPLSGPEPSKDCDSCLLGGLLKTTTALLDTTLDTTTSLLDTTLFLVDNTLDLVVNDLLEDVLSVVVDGSKTLLQLTTGKIEFYTQTLLNKTILTIAYLVEGIDCLIHHTFVTVDGVVQQVVVKVSLILDDVILVLKETLDFVGGALDPDHGFLDIECTWKATGHLLHSVYEIVDGVVSKVEETLSGGGDDNDTNILHLLLGNQLVPVHDLLTLVLSTIQNNVDGLDVEFLSKLDLTGDITNVARTILMGDNGDAGTQIIPVVGGRVEWITANLLGDILWTVELLLDSAVCLVSHVVHYVGDLLEKVVLLVDTTLAGVLVTIEQTLWYNADGLLDKTMWKVISLLDDGAIHLETVLELVNGGVLQLVSETVSGGTLKDAKALLGHALTDVDGLLQLILSTVQDHPDDKTASLLSIVDLESSLGLLCGDLIDGLGLGKLLDGVLLGGLDVNLGLCPCFAAQDLLNIQACVQVQDGQYLDTVGLSVCPDVNVDAADGSIEAGLLADANILNVIAKVDVNLNGLLECTLKGDGERRSLQQQRQQLRSGDGHHRQLLLGGLLKSVKKTVDTVVDTAVDTVDGTVNTVGDTVDGTVKTVFNTVDSVVDTVVTVVDTLISGLTFDEYNSCLALLLRTCEDVQECGP